MDNVQHLLLSSDPTLTYIEIYEALKTTDTPNHETGYGVVNVVEAFKKTPKEQIKKTLLEYGRWY